VAAGRSDPENIANTWRKPTDDSDGVVELALLGAVEEASPSKWTYTSTDLEVVDHALDDA
jgi:hypothetical protein